MNINLWAKKCRGQSRYGGYGSYTPLMLHSYSVTQVVYNCIQQEFVNHADKFHIILVSFEVTVFIHIQHKMPFSVLILVSLTLSYLPVSLSYRDGARSESCYNMLVMHTNFLGQVVSPTECGNTCPFELRLVGRVNAETTYQFGEIYHCK